MDIIDDVAIDGLSAPVRIGIANVDGALRFFAVSGACDVLAAPLFQQEVLGRLMACMRLPTRHGVIEFDASAVLPPLPWRLADGDSGASSNCVSRLMAGAVPLVHKVYRQLARANVELEASMRLDRVAPGLLARCVGGYRYRGADGSQVTLGLVTEYVQGEGAHAAMSRDLRALWAGDANQADPGLLDQLAGWRGFLTHFHGVIERTFGGGAAAPDFDLDAFCADARKRLGRLRPRLHGDALLGTEVARRLSHSFDRLEAGCFAPPTGAESLLRASACHGDLHLSHLLAQAEGVQRRLIDFSPLALTPDDAGFRASSDLLDWAALERALDYFFLDEAALALSQQSGQHQQQAMHGLIGRAMGTRAGHWRTQVRAALCGPQHASAARRRFYFSRLLQELEYNYDHQRPYYRCIDFCSLLEQFSHPSREDMRAYR